MRALLLALALCSFVSSFSEAQLVAPDKLEFTDHNHKVEPASIIDGSKTPDLIPDVTAYRLYFLAVAQRADATADQQKLQRLHIQRLDITESETQTLRSVLEEFRVQYEYWLEWYNTEAAEALTRGEAPNFLVLVSERDRIVQSTRDKLKQLLSPEAIGKLDSLIKREKANMKAAPRPNGQGGEPQ
jgi:hypothetical protein